MRTIRGHHLFCMALFAGHGYSEEFTRNMSAVIESLQKGEPLRLTEGPDDICAHCPNLLPGGGCAHGTEDVLHRDRGAFAALWAAPGQQTTWEQARQGLLGVDGEGFEKVCGQCRWAAEGLCSLALLQKRLA